MNRRTLTAVSTTLLPLLLELLHCKDCCCCRVVVKAKSHDALQPRVVKAKPLDHLQLKVVVKAKLHDALQPIVVVKAN